MSNKERAVGYKETLKKIGFVAIAFGGATYILTGNGVGVILGGILLTIPSVVSRGKKE